VAIEVKDNGHGIPKENLIHIFEPFFTTKKEFGTGLGLWVSKELVVKNHGTMRVMSSTDAHNHGTIFEIALPAAKPATTPTDTLAEAERAG
jgi:signal transduction histidine kinase